MADLSWEELEQELAGGSPSKAAAPAPAAVQTSAPQSAPGTAEVIGRGALQGATMKSSDEIAGAINAAAVKDPGWLGGLLAMSPLGSAIYSLINKTRPELIADYRTGRDEERAKNEAAQEARPGLYTASEIGGGIATAPLLPGGAPKTVLGMVGAGLGYGGVTGAMGSKGDLTRGQVGEVATDTLVGAGAGAAAGTVVGTAGKTLGYGVAKVSGKAAVRKAAQSAAEQADELSAMGHNATIRDTTRAGLSLEEQVSGDIGEKIRLRPSQLTGDPSLALAESKASQMGGKIMLRAQAEEAKQLRQASRWLDVQANRIAAKPELLGREDVGNQLAKTIELHVDSLIKARAAAAGPLYEAAEQSGLTVNMLPVKAVLEKQIKESYFAPNAISGELKTILDKIGDSDVLSIEMTQNLRSLLTKTTQGKGTIIKDMTVANQARIAREILDSVDQALEETANQSPYPWAANGARLLQQANAVWREHSKVIENDATATVERLLNIGQSDASDTVVTKLLQASPQQIRGVFKVLNTQPEVSQQVRGQLLEDLMVKAGKLQRGSPNAAELGAARLRPATALKLLVDNEPKLQAAYAGDEGAQVSLKQSMALLQRLSFGPGLKGSQTAPLVAQEMEEIALRAATVAAGPKAGLLLELGRKLIGSDKAVAKAVSSPEGLDLMRDALKMHVALNKGQKITPSSASSLLARATALGFLGEGAAVQAVADPNQPPTDASQPRRLVMGQ